MIRGFIALWRIASWLRSEKKAMEADIDGYLTQERAKEWRLHLEKIFHGLEIGYRKEMLPGPVKWFFDQTTADNRIGMFGMYLLKSHKINIADDEALNQPIKPYRAH